MVDCRTIARFCRRLFLGIAISFISCSAFLGGSRAAEPVFYLSTLLWFAVLSICYLRWRDTGSAGCQVSKAAKWAGRCELAAFNTALFLALAEALLRVTADLSGGSILLSNALEGHLLQPGRDYGNGLRGNQLGFPGREFTPEKQPDVWRVAALGDSFAVGPAVAYSDNYLTLLEDGEPDLEVYNFGVSGTGPREYRLIWERQVRKFVPDIVLVSLFIGNDITERLATTRHMDPDCLAVYTFCKRSCRLITERCRVESHSTPGSRDLAAPTFSVEAFQGVEARRLEICLKSESARLEKKWRRTFKELRSLIADCRRSNVPIAFVIIPDEFQVNPSVLAEALATRGGDPGDVDLELPQRRLRAFLAELDVPILDLLPAFGQATDLYAIRDTHWNARGNRRAAAAISGWLRGLLSRVYPASRRAASSNSWK